MSINCATISTEVAFCGKIFTFLNIHWVVWNQSQHYHREHMVCNMEIDTYTHTHSHVKTQMTNQTENELVPHQSKVILFWYFWRALALVTMFNSGFIISVTQNIIHYFVGKLKILNGWFCLFFSSATIPKEIEMNLIGHVLNTDLFYSIERKCILSIAQRMWTDCQAHQANETRRYVDLSAHSTIHILKIYGTQASG